MNYRLIYISLAVFMVFYLAGCQKEKKTERDYPQVKTLAVDKITPEGARFNAAIISGDAETITEHGFVWGQYDMLTLSNSDKICVEDAPETDQFSINITSSLVAMKEYYVRSYIKSGVLTIYGDPMKFTSLGSMAPEITGFEPKTASWGDTITIYGKNFSSQPYWNTVHFGNLIAQVISCNNETLKVRVPDVTNIYSEISEEVLGNRGVAPELFELITPGKITAIDKKNVTWGDTLILTGIFPFSKYTLKILMDKIPATILESSESKIKMVVPPMLKYYDSVSVDLSINNHLVQAAEKNHMVQPFISTVGNSDFGWGDTIALTGLFNPLSVNNLIYFSGIQANIVESANKKIKCVVPDLNSHVASLSCKISTYAINYSTDISLSGPVIKSISPAKVPSNNNILIRGKYFKEGITKVKINGILCASSAYSEEIYAIVPSVSNGMATVEVDVYNKSATNSNLLEVINPKITDFTPKEGVVGNIITISGVGFDPGDLGVSIGGITVPVIESSDTQIKIKVPAGVPANSTITVYIYGTVVSSVQSFHLLPPKIFSIEPLSAKPGAVITVKGENFTPDLIDVNVEYLTAVIISATPSEIQFIMPDQLKGEYSLSVNTYSYYITSSEKISCLTPWESVRIMPRTPNSGMGVVLADEIFVFGGFNSQNSYITYLIMGGSASEGLTCPNFSQVEGDAYNVSDIGYLGLGRLQAGGYTNDFYRFDPSNRTWTAAASFPGTARSRSFYFSIGSKCFLGAGSNQETLFNDFWIFDASSNSWSSSGTYPGGNTQMAYAQVANGKGYVIDGNQLWEYTPEDNSWLKKADFPGAARNMGCGFTINNNIYFGTGYTETTVLNDFWKYDPSTDQWQKLTNYPYKGYGSYGGSYNGTGYMGGGFGGDYRYWEETRLLKYVPENE
jgi:hypothetical protein